MGRPRKRRREDEGPGLLHSNNLEQCPDSSFDTSSPHLYDFTGNLQSTPSFIHNMNFETPFDPDCIPVDPSLELSILRHSPHQGFGPDENRNPFEANGNSFHDNGNTGQANGNQFQDYSPNFSTPSSDVQITLAKCSCLSDMYLTLQTLQIYETFEFPDTLPLLRNSIQSTKAVLECPQCPKESTSAMQNIMLLTTLLTSITDCYRKLLLSIDTEAKRVEEAGEKKHFRMGDSSPEKAHLHTGTLDCPMGFYVDLNGQEWRTLARKVVKADVVGSGVALNSSAVLGLADMLEERQRRWHRDPKTLEIRTHFSKDGIHCAPRDGEFSCLKMVGMVRRHVDLLDL
jgi:hypothetical protein